MSDLVDLKDYLDGLVGDDPGFNEVEWAVKAIERLQRDSDAWKKLSNTRQTKIKELEGKLNACRMYSRTLEVSGSKAMDKIAEMEMELLEEFEDQAGESI